MARHGIRSSRQKGHPMTTDQTIPQQPPSGLVDDMIDRLLEPHRGHTTGPEPWQVARSVNRQLQAEGYSPLPAPSG